MLLPFHLGIEEHPEKSGESQPVSGDGENSDTVEINEETKPYYPDTFLETESNAYHTVSTLLGHIKRSETEDHSDLKRISVAALTLVLNMEEIKSPKSELQRINRFGLERFAGSDDDIRFWTGFYSYRALMYFYEGFVAPNLKNIKYWGAMNCEVEKEKSGPNRSVQEVDEVFMTLVKLRRGSANKDIGDRFMLGESHVSRIFTTYIKLMANIFRSMDIWPARGKVKKYMPDCFKPLYQDVRVIIDCTELRCQKPSDFEAQSATYSNYKSRGEWGVLSQI